MFCKWTAYSRIKDFLEEYGESNLDINGKRVDSIWDLLSKVDFYYLSQGKPVVFHGDFILDNIIQTENSFCLIDWRQDFAGQLDIGDLYYDLAKLNHNLTVNHDIVNKGLFNNFLKFLSVKGFGLETFSLISSSPITWEPSWEIGLQSI